MQNVRLIKTNDDYLTLIAGEAEFLNINLYDTMGRLLRASKIYGRQRINIRDLPNGVYFAVASGQFGTFVKKFIKY